MAVILSVFCFVFVFKKEDKLKYVIKSKSNTLNLLSAFLTR